MIEASEAGGELEDGETTRATRIDAFGYLALTVPHANGVLQVKMQTARARLERPRRQQACAVLLPPCDRLRVLAVDVQH